MNASLFAKVPNYKYPAYRGLNGGKIYDYYSLFVCFDSLRPINNLSVKQGRVFLGRN